MPINFNMDFEPHYASPVAIAKNIVRITCNNVSPFTFYGTNTYIVGEKSLAVIDPGPSDDEHLAAILDAIKKRPVSHILLTHTHSDHSPLAKKLQQHTNAPTLAFAAHKKHKNNPLEASADYDFIPDKKIKHLNKINGDGWQLIALHTPGHTENHLSFTLVDTPFLFSGDHVMAWSTSIVAPPEGSMFDYMNSLQLLLQQKQNIYLPGHGGEIEDAHKFVRDLRDHRLARENDILQLIINDTTDIREIVNTLYKDIPPHLHGAAALSVEAHLQHLVLQKKITQQDKKYYLLH